MTEKLLKRALAALEESVDHVTNDYQTDWRHGLPTRQAQLDGKKQTMDEHIAVIAAIRAHLAATRPTPITYKLSETDIYNFAGWLTCRSGVMPVGSTSDAAPMAEAVNEYITTFTERFSAHPAPQPLSEEQIEDIWEASSKYHDDTLNIIEFARAIEAAKATGGAE